MFEDRRGIRARELASRPEAPGNRVRTGVSVSDRPSGSRPVSGDSARRFKESVSRASLMGIVCWRRVVGRIVPVSRVVERHVGTDRLIVDAGRGISRLYLLDAVVYSERLQYPYIRTLKGSGLCLASGSRERHTPCFDAITGAVRSSEISRKWPVVTTCSDHLVRWTLESHQTVRISNIVYFSWRHRRWNVAQS